MGLGDFVSGIFGSKNENHATAPTLNGDAYQYGGAPGGAAAAAGDLGMRANRAEDRGAAQLGTGQLDQSRGDQQSALGLSRDAALGNAPSVASGLMQQGTDANIRSQMAMANSGRGAAALAGGQYNAAVNSGGIAQQAVGQQANLRAGEMAQARGEYASGANNLRTSDMNQAGAQLGADMQQRGLNDQYSLGLTGDQLHVNDSQLQAQMGQQAQQSANDLAAQGLNQKTDAQNANTNQGGGMFGAGALGSAAGAVASDARNKTDAANVSGGPIPMDFLQSVYGQGSYEQARPNGVAQAFPQYGIDHGIQGPPSAAPVAAEVIPAAPNLGPQNGISYVMEGQQGAAGAGVKAAAPTVQEQKMNQAAAGVEEKGKGEGPKSDFESGASFGESLAGIGKGIGSAFKGLSDVDAKTDIAPVGGGGGVGDFLKSKQADIDALMNGEPGHRDQDWAQKGKDAFATAQAGAMNPKNDLSANARLTDLISDRAHKENVSPATSEGVRTAAPAEFLDSLTTHAYNYKPGVGEDPSKRRFGPMAQEIERTPMGASLVIDTPGGKMLDIKHGFGVALGALGNLNDRQRIMEAKMDAMMGKGARRG